jgi:antitoxin PrlF
VTETLDVIVLGAGMAGAAAAAHLAPHADALLAQAEDRPGRHATGRSAAMFFETRGNADVRVLARASRDFLPHPHDSFAATPLMRRRDALFVATQAQRAALRALRADAGSCRRRPVLRPHLGLDEGGSTSSRITRGRKAALARGRSWPALPVRRVRQQLSLSKPTIEPKDCCRALRRTGSPGHEELVQPYQKLPLGKTLKPCSPVLVLLCCTLVTLQGKRMTTTLTSKGQVTIPKRIRDELQLLPGAPVQFSVNAAGEVVLHRPRPAKGLRRPKLDRFEVVRGRADVRWRTDDLMKLLRSDD